MFHEMRRKIFMKLIFYISVSDFFMNISSAFGFPANGSILCYLQGTMELYFSLASWLWTTALCFAVFTIMWNGRLYIDMRFVHIICWGIPTLATFLPFITSTYGSPSPDTQWCLIVAKDGQSVDNYVKFWSYASYFFWLFLCIFLMLLWTAMVFGRLVWQQTVMSDVVKKTYSKLWIYPLFMLICWSLNYAIIQFSAAQSPLSVGLSMVCGISNGIFTSIGFFVKSEEARGRWYEYLFQSTATRNSIVVIIEEDFVEDQALELRPTVDPNNVSIITGKQSTSGSGRSTFFRQTMDIEHVSNAMHNTGNNSMSMLGLGLKNSY